MKEGAVGTMTRGYTYMDYSGPFFSCSPTVLWFGVQGRLLDLDTQYTYIYIYTHINHMCVRVQGPNETHTENDMGTRCLHKSLSN